MNHLWTIIMAGGLGSRFWPVSGVDCPKQFIDVIGVGRSMLQLTFERFEKICPREHIIIVTGEPYVERVREQVPDLLPYQVLGEPLRRNTAPCIAYAASVIAHLDPEATLIVSPSDHAIFHYERFFNDLQQAVETVQEHEWIITLGAQPVKPDTSYGYIQFREQPSLPEAHNLHKVVTFTEKPPVEMARQFIASGEFFWNAGILVWRLPVLRQAYNTYLPAIAASFFNLSLDTDHSTLEQVYSQSEAISVDNGIMEKAGNVHVLAASFGWSDVETWDSLYGVFRHDKDDNAVVNGEMLAYDTRNCVVIIPEGKTAVLEGLDGYIVAATDDTLMICRRKSEELIFKFASDVELKKLIENK
ncbi:MAG: mannose-1-phosphate guanylyltransferase [Bacteroidales bacterium]|nr:mannose-1-phosphate guanylyltransferase [Bacteroidales bacterium]MBR5092181.1 mannose-1-phosphate guanylyltransferase [Bacteroidales bacterium]